MNMRTTTTFVVIACLLVAGLLYSVTRGPASDHQDSPLTVSRPGADITDVFLFPSSNPNNVVLAMDVHPLIPRAMSSGVALDPAVLYQLKVDTTGDFREDRVLQFRAEGSGSSQRIAFSGVTTPSTVGTRSTWAGNSTVVPFGQIANAPDGIRIFAGPRREPFYFDLSQFFKLIPDRNYRNQPNPPPPTATCFRKPGIDFFRDYNVLSIVADVPRSLLAGPQGKLGIVHLYATTSLAGSSGEYVQVERLARPGIKEVFEAFKSHDASNRSAPWADPQLANSISAFMMAPKPNGAGRSSELATAVRNTLTPDELTADLSAPGPAAYLAVETNGKSALPTGIVRIVPEAGLKGLKKSIANKTRDFGGRDPSSPVIDLSLGIIYGTLGQKVGLAQDDGKDTACLTSDNVTAESRGVTQSFPYLGNPI